MCHVVAGYPDTKTCLELMKGLHDSGAAALEIQIPFSDPIADGETIMQANDVVLDHGMTTAGSFELIEQARRQGVDSELYIMSYLQKVRHFGLAEFCKRATNCQVKGLIIPDLPYDSPEFSELHDLATKLQLEVVPVLSPGMPDSRLKAALAFKPPTLYVTSLRGITGNAYAPDHHLKQLIAAIKEVSEAKIMIGFGITTVGDVRDALELGDVAVIGSAIINNLQSSSMTDTMTYIKSLVTG
jgi:tryptophan synthase alpha subunit